MYCIKELKNLLLTTQKNRSVEVFYDDENLLKNRFIIELIEKYHYNIQLSISTTQFVYIQTNIESPKRSQTSSGARN